MWKCEECGSVFDGDDAAKEYDDPSPVGVALPQGRYEYWRCPSCGSDDMTEAHQCKSCDEYTDGISTLCDDCKSELADALDGIRHKMNMTVDDFEDAVAESFGW